MSTTMQNLPTLVEDYLRVRRALGYKLEGTERILGRFLAYLKARGASRVSVTDALGFATAPPAVAPRSQALRLSAVRCFTRWARTLDPEGIEVPPARLLPARPTRVAPYIYTNQEIQALLDAAATLQPKLRAETYRTLIGLMAATGIRTGEALGLNVADYDAQENTLTVTGKYGKIRRLPLHTSTGEALTGYLEVRRGFPLAQADPALLISTRRTRLHPSGVHPTFRRLAIMAGLGPASSSCRPRLHDLRHRIAVKTMLDAYRRGDDPAVVLPILSTWLGHTEPSDTYWYLTGTTELLEAAATRVDELADERSRS